MEVAILIASTGDGGACLRWFTDVSLAEVVAESDEFCEELGMNEGCPTLIEVPYDWVPPGGYDDHYYREELGNV